MIQNETIIKSARTSDLAQWSADNQKRPDKKISRNHLSRFLIKLTFAVVSSDRSTNLILMNM